MAQGGIGLGPWWDTWVGGGLVIIFVCREAGGQIPGKPVPGQCAGLDRDVLLACSWCQTRGVRTLDPSGSPCQPSELWAACGGALGPALGDTPRLPRESARKRRVGNLVPALLPASPATPTTTHSLSLQILVEHLLCARHHRRYSGDRESATWPPPCPPQVHAHMLSEPLKN